MEDGPTISRIKDGDVQSFSVLVEKYHRRLLNFIYRLVGDEKIVEDIGQEVFLEVYKSLKNFDEKRGTPFSAWLFIIARNRCISELRKRNSSVRISLEEMDVSELGIDIWTAESLLMEKERWNALRSSLVGLSEHLRKPMDMCLRGSTLEEIASACGILPGTVKSRLFRAKGKMRLSMKGCFGGKWYERV